MSLSKKPRIEIIDALRGFALAGIFICHIVEQYIGAGSPEAHSEAVNITIVDKVIEGFIFIFLRGKFIALFSFLFGLSFFIQMNNGTRKGRDFRLRFLWRLFILFGIGYLHSLFYRGDILTIYAVLGIFLIPFFKSNTKWVLSVATLLFLGLGRYIIFFFTGGDHLFLNIDPLNMEAAHIIDYYNTLKKGDLLEVFQTNSWVGHLDKMNVQYSIFGRGYFTFGFFLIGLYIGRSGYFEHLHDNQVFTKRILKYALTLLIIAILIMIVSFMSMGDNAEINSWPGMIGLSGYDLVNASMTVIYIALFVILYRKIRFEKLFSSFAYYGRMALTNYILQTLIGTFLLYGWGLGKIGEVSNLFTLITGTILIISQMWISRLWLKRFNYGPAEWLWRSLTFFKIFPLKK